MKKGIVLSIASFSMFTLFTSILLNIDKIGCFKGVSNKSNYEMIESVSASANQLEKLEAAKAAGLVYLSQSPEVTS